MSNHFSLDPDVIGQLLPLGDAAIAAFITIVGSVVTYYLGKGKTKQEIDNLKAEKTKIEAASGYTTAEAAQVITAAAANTVSPLLERIKEQREEIKFLTERNVFYRNEIDDVKTHAARLAAENELLRERFKLRGETPPILPPEV